MIRVIGFIFIAFLLGSAQLFCLVAGKMTGTVNAGIHERVTIPSLITFVIMLVVGYYSAKDSKYCYYYYGASLASSLIYIFVIPLLISLQMISLMAVNVGVSSFIGVKLGQNAVNKFKADLIKRPLFWFLSPIFLFYPYRYLIFNVFDKFLRNPSLSEEKQQMLLSADFLLTFIPFSIFCFVVGGVTKLHFYTANKKLDKLKEFIRIPKNIDAAHWIKFSLKSNWGIQAILFGEDLSDLVKDLPVSNQTFYAIPEWAKRYFPKDDMASIDISINQIFNKGMCRGALIYLIDDNTVYIEIDTK